MGLDSYIEHCWRFSDADIRAINGLSYSQVMTLYPNAFIIEQKDIERGPEMYSDLEFLLRKVIIRNAYIDTSKIKADNGIPEDARQVVYHMGNGYIGYTYQFDNQTKEVNLNDQEIDKYKYYQDDECYVCGSEEVYYWRKDYDVQEFFYDRHPVENCGYYKTSYEELAELAAEVGQPKILYDIPDIKDEDNEGLFYHEWY